MQTSKDQVAPDDPLRGFLIPNPDCECAIVVCPNCLKPDEVDDADPIMDKFPDVCHRCGIKIE